jgi:hypothetical protein
MSSSWQQVLNTRAQCTKSPPHNFYGGVPTSRSGGTNILTRASAGGDTTHDPCMQANIYISATIISLLVQESEPILHIQAKSCASCNNYAVALSRQGSFDPTVQVETCTSKVVTQVHGYGLLQTRWDHTPRPSTATMAFNDILRKSYNTGQ